MRPACCLLATLLLCHCSSPTPPRRLSLELTGKNDRWWTRHPGPDGRLHSEDDLFSEGDMVVPMKTRLTLRLTSEDLIYMFRLPALDQKQMAVPELFFELTFDSGEPAEYVMEGDQMCGFAHERLIVAFKVVTPAEYRAWQAAQRKQTAAR